jgi:uncharacterized protein (TIGR03067 family)
MATREPSLDGWWIAIDGEIGGVPLPQEALSELPLRVENGTFRFGSDEGCAVLNRHVRPRTLDIIPTRGPNRGRIVPAIIDLTDTSLRICCDLSGTSRPPTFASPAGTRRFLANYRRVVPGE